MREYGSVRGVMTSYILLTNRNKEA